MAMPPFADARQTPLMLGEPADADPRRRGAPSGALAARLSCAGALLVAAVWFLSTRAPPSGAGAAFRAPVDLDMLAVPAALPNSTIVIFRHAECNADVCHYTLCPSGLGRANFMATLFKPEVAQENEAAGRAQDQAPYFPKPDRLVALDPWVDPFRAREIETIGPLSFHSGVPIEADGWARDTEVKLASNLLNYSVANPGSLQVVSWHHTSVATLARALGCPPDAPNMAGMCGPKGDAWDNDEFRFFFELTLVPVIVGNMTNFTVEARLVTMGYVPPCDGKCLFPGQGNYPCAVTPAPFTVAS
mmetsp:Transcript_49218/g.145296  ORF Transcript_49218/g.145296 Transcript_49218/m.145296 type:complete len:303 (-) Transcript_49218:12-920(-)